MVHPKILSSGETFAASCYEVIADAVPQSDGLKSLEIVRAFDPLYGEAAILFNRARMYRPRGSEDLTAPWKSPAEYGDSISPANFMERSRGLGKERRFADIDIDDIPYFFASNDFPVVPNSGLLVVDRDGDYQEHAALSMIHSLRFAEQLPGDIVLWNDKRLGASQRRRHYHLFRPFQRPYREDPIVNPFPAYPLNSIADYQRVIRKDGIDVYFSGDPFALLLIRSRNIGHILQLYTAFVAAWVVIDPGLNGVDFAVKWDDFTRQYHILLDARRRTPVSEFKFGHASIADKLGICCVERPATELYLHSQPEVLYRSVMESMRIPAELSGLLGEQISNALSEIFPKS